MTWSVWSLLRDLLLWMVLFAVSAFLFVIGSASFLIAGPSRLALSG